MGVCDTNKQQNSLINRGIIQELPQVPKKKNKTEDNDSQGYKTIPIELIMKSEKSICKINHGNESGTGFFLEYNSNYYLVTNYHVVSEVINNIEIEIWNKNLTKLNLNNRNIKFLPRPKDITAIQINPNEIKDIEYLKYDLISERGYNQYLNKYAICIGYPSGDLSAQSGQIKEIDKFELYYDIPTEVGSSGSPIILFNSFVIGIHKLANDEKRLNKGTFIYELIKEIKI